jgi:hypothetical protein
MIQWNIPNEYLENSLEKERLRRFLHAAGAHLRKAARSRHVQWMAQERNPQGDRANLRSKELHPGVGGGEASGISLFLRGPRSGE